MARGKYCSVCHSGYRTWAEHASSERHRKNVYRRDNPQKRGRQHKRIARDRAFSRMHREETDPDADKVKVRPHRRRPPLDGPRKRVAVRKYRRAKPYVFYDVTTGKSTRLSSWRNR